MRRKITHGADVLVPLMLFAAFALSAILVVLYGAGIYRDTVAASSKNNTSRTALAYICEKLHRNDGGEEILLSTFGDGDALVIPTRVGDEVYDTVIYLYDGSLRELFVRRGTEADPSRGTALLGLTKLSISREGKVFVFSCIDEEGQVSDLCVALSAGGKTS